MEGLHTTLSEQSNRPTIPASGIACGAATPLQNVKTSRLPEAPVKQTSSSPSKQPKRTSSSASKKSPMPNTQLVINRKSQASQKTLLPQIFITKKRVPMSKPEWKGPVTVDLTEEGPSPIMSTAHRTSGQSPASISQGKSGSQSLESSNATTGHRTDSDSPPAKKRKRDYSGKRHSQNSSSYEPPDSASSIYGLSIRSSVGPCTFTTTTTSSSSSSSSSSNTEYNILDPLQALEDTTLSISPVPDRRTDDALRRENESLLSRNSRIDFERLVLDCDLRNAKGIVNVQKDEIAELKSKLAEKDCRAAVYEREKVEWKKEKEEFLKRIQGMEGQLSEQEEAQDTSQMSALQPRIEDLEKRLSEAAERESTLHGRLQTHEDRERKANIQIDELGDQLTRADDQLAKLKSDLTKSMETEMMLRRVVEHFENVAKGRTARETDFSPQNSTLADEVANFQARNKALTEELETSRSYHIRKVEELKSASAALRKELEDSKSQNLNLKMDKSKSNTELKKNIKKQDDQLLAARDNEVRLRTQLAKLDAACKAANDDLARAYSRIQLLSSNLKIEQISVQAKNKELLKYQAEASELRSEWDEEKKRWDEQLVAHRQTEEQLQAQLDDLKKASSSAKGEQQMAVIRNGLLRTDLKNSQTAVQELEGQVKDLNGKLVKSESQEVELRKQVDALDKHAQRQNLTVAELEENLQQQVEISKTLQSRISELESDLEDCASAIIKTADTAYKSFPKSFQSEAIEACVDEGFEKQEELTAIYRQAHRNSDLQEALQEEKNANPNVRKALAKLEHIEAAVRSKFAELINVIEKKTSSVESLHTELNVCRGTETSLRDYITTLNKELDVEKAAIRDHRMVLEEMQERAKAVEIQVSGLRTALKVQNLENEDLRQRLTALPVLEKAVKDEKLNSENLRNSLSFLENKQATIVNENNELQRALENQRKIYEDLQREVTERNGLKTYETQRSTIFTELDDLRFDDVPDLSMAAACERQVDENRQMSLPLFEPVPSHNSTSNGFVQMSLVSDAEVSRAINMVELESSLNAEVAALNKAVEAEKATSEDLRKQLAMVHVQLDAEKCERSNQETSTASLNRINQDLQSRLGAVETNLNDERAIADSLRKSLSIYEDAPLINRGRELNTFVGTRNVQMAFRAGLQQQQDGTIQELDRTEVGELKNAILEKDEALNAARQQVKLQERTIFDNNAHVRMQNSVIQQKDKMLKERDAAIQQKDYTIFQLSITSQKQMTLIESLSQGNSINDIRKQLEQTVNDCDQPWSQPAMQQPGAMQHFEEPLNVRFALQEQHWTRQVENVRQGAVQQAEQARNEASRKQSKTMRRLQRDKENLV